MLRNICETVAPEIKNQQIPKNNQQSQAPKDCHHHKTLINFSSLPKQGKTPVAKA